MTTYFMIFLTIVTVFVVAAGLIKVGKVPKMPAFYRNKIGRCFQPIDFQELFFQKSVRTWKTIAGNRD